jgi:hypothetical protein
MKFNYKFLLKFLLCAALVSCNSDSDSGNLTNPTLLTSRNSFSESTEIGNFVTTAVRRALDVDFVFLPSKYFANESMVLEINENMTEAEIEDVLENFPVDPQDQLLVGAMDGDDIRQFIIQRSQELYNLDLETAGLWYRVIFKGGFLASSEFLVDGQMPLEDDRTYRIAISDDFFFGSAFPGYKFRNGFNFNFRRERYQQSIRESIRAYLTQSRFRFPFWSSVRAEVKNIEYPDLGFKKINEIQGSAHSSPLLAHRVTTRGVVTAVGTDRWYPFDLDIYIQSQESDSDPRTSEGLHITSLDNSVDVRIGQLIEVSGYVMEEARANGMGETTLRVTEPVRVLEESVPLPEPVSLASVPIDRVSRHAGGPLMSKESLDLRDGIDFWESVEGMRVKTRDLVVSGFRGGGEDLIEISDRFYLNLYVYSKEAFSENLLSRSNGLMIDHDNVDHNPELFVITTNHLSKGIQVQKSNGDYYYYNVGDEIKGEVVGVMTYPKNIFGGGEYALVTPEPQEALQYSNIQSQGFVPLTQRPRSNFQVVDDPNTITVSTFNLENLAGNRQDRIDVLAEVLEENLNCPDLINLVEIQDNNGISFRGGANADLTLKKVRVATQQRCLNSDYEFVNVDPFELSEGGQPGGNIRVSVMYNKEKLDFTYRGDPSLYGAHSVPTAGGDISVNPGRVFPLDPAFRRSRRSPVMQFSLKSKPEEKIYMIGAHFNSKLGDIDFWGNRQPAVQLSDDRRSAMAAKLNEFVRWIEQENPEANIIVLGDFNALAEENSMAVLTENETRLRNTIFTMNENAQYTTNHNGNSQALDYIFINRKIYEKPCTEAEYLHMNSDYMGRISDHDPVNLKVCF